MPNPSLGFTTRKEEEITKDRIFAFLLGGHENVAEVDFSKVQ